MENIRQDKEQLQQNIKDLVQEFWDKYPYVEVRFQGSTDERKHNFNDGNTFTVHKDVISIVTISV